jgi:Ca2+-binding RTX toxin-like protein
MLIEAITQTTQGHVYILGGNDDLHVGAGTVITSSATDAVTMWQGTHIITVDGTINGYDDGINTIGCETAQTIVIQASGRINSGGDGVVTESDGVIVDGLNSSVTNYGTINSYGSCVDLLVRDFGTTTVTNAGTMIAHNYGIVNKFGSGTLVFTNTGTVESPTKSFFGGNYVDLVTNKGIMRGTVDLGAGNDLYDGRGGSVVGSILGGDGDDRIIAGNAAETIDGGLGVDLLDFGTRTNAITVDLTTPANNRGTGVIGDRYTGIENLAGGSMADKLTGDAGANSLLGNAGADTIKGGAGDDWMEGGAGKDNLTGGSEADSFVFNATTGMGDLILDFTTGVDHIVLNAAAFGYGVATGALAAADFITSTSAVARDASDHFIFRTTDKTLWFDADGAGGRAAVLLADLQSGASMAAADILFI